jgi:hypothetical protein
MAITRANATAYLTSTFSALFATISETSYDWPIDQALRLLGTEESDLATATVEESERLKYFAAADYYAATLICRRLASQGGSFSTGPHSENNSGMIDAAKEMLDEAKERAKETGLSIGSDIPTFDASPVWTEPTVTWDKLDG